MTKDVDDVLEPKPQKNVRSWTWSTHYFSTACLHREHDKCRLHCKYCRKECRCSCHRTAKVTA